MKKLLLYILCCAPAILTFSSGTSAQEKDFFIHFTDDSLFFKAQNMALDGKWDRAREAALDLLERNPLYHDASILIARLFAWEKNYDSARVFIRNVTDQSPGYHDAMSALVDIEIWDGNYSAALETAEIALSFHPGDKGFLYQKARAFLYQDMENETRETLANLLEIYPDNEEAVDLLKTLDAPGFYYYRENSYLMSGYYGEYFHEPYSRNFHMGTAGYSHFISPGPVTVKLNFANTYFDGTGMTRYPSLQYEIESYPRLSPDSYLLLNYAYSRRRSPGQVFPGHRGAFEYFRNLPRGFEASLGLRFMYWDKTYFFYTGSVGKYYGNMWFSFRPYIFPGDNGWSGSWYFNARKYFSSADDFAGIVLGFGLSPDETLSDLTERLYLNTTSIGVELSKSIGEAYLIRSSLRYEYEEYRVSEFRNRWSFNLGLRYYLTSR